MFKINCGEGSAAKSSHTRNIINYIGILGKHREHCEYIPTLQNLQSTALGLRQFCLDGKTKHLNPFRISDSDANIKWGGEKVCLCTPFWRVWESKYR
jgi:hypothetical protein